MRAFVALMTAAGALVIGMATLSLAADETDLEPDSNAEMVGELLEELAVAFAEPLGVGLPYLLIAALVLIGAGVLVAAQRGGR